MAVDTLMKNNVSICFYLFILTGTASMPSFAQRTGGEHGYPSRPIRFIVPQATGGSNDMMARFMGHHLSERLGKQDIVALGKAKPGYINMASAGGFQHFVSELFRSMAGIEMAILLYKGGFPAIINRLSAEISAIIKLPETQKRLTAEGAETDFKPAAEIDKIIKAELIKWARVAKDARMASEK